MKDTYPFLEISLTSSAEHKRRLRLMAEQHLDDKGEFELKANTPYEIIVPGKKGAKKETWQLHNDVSKYSSSNKPGIYKYVTTKKYDLKSFNPDIAPTKDQNIRGKGAHAVVIRSGPVMSFLGEDSVDIQEPKEKKVIKVISKVSEGKWQDIAKEAQIQKAIEVQRWGKAKTKEPIVIDGPDGKIVKIIMPERDGVELFRLLDVKKDGVSRDLDKLDYDQRLVIAMGLIKEVKDFQGGEDGFVHRDMGPRNFLLDLETLLVHLIDFDSVRAKKDIAARRYCGTPGYISYEQSKGADNAKSDVWSIANILAELFGATYPTYHQDAVFDNYSEYGKIDKEIDELVLECGEVEGDDQRREAINQEILDKEKRLNELMQERPEKEKKMFNIELDGLCSGFKLPENDQKVIKDCLTKMGEKLDTNRSNIDTVFETFSKLIENRPKANLTLLSSQLKAAQTILKNEVRKLKRETPANLTELTKIKKDIDTLCEDIDKVLKPKKDKDAGLAPRAEIDSVTYSKFYLRAVSVLPDDTQAKAFTPKEKNQLKQIDKLTRPLSLDLKHLSGSAQIRGYDVIKAAHKKVQELKAKRSRPTSPVGTKSPHSRSPRQKKPKI